MKSCCAISPGPARLGEEVKLEKKPGIFALFGPNNAEPRACPLALTSLGEGCPRTDTSIARTATESTARFLKYTVCLYSLQW